MSILDKHFDNVLMGKSSLSCLLALGLLKANQRILVIDDERLSYGSLYSQNLGELEKEFLSIMAEDEDITPLKEINNYLQPAPQRFIVNERQIFLGRRPWQNFVELNRKFPEIFNQRGLTEVENILSSSAAKDEFDELVYSTSHRIAASAVRVDGVEQLNFTLFLNQCPELLKNLFEVFSQELSFFEQSEDPSHRTTRGLLYVFRSFYQQQMGGEFDQIELFHLFMSILSPRYQLDDSVLTNDLLDLCLRRGGQFKCTTVREWKFHKQAPWSIELASFDGIIHPQRISFFGGGLEKTPFRAESDIGQYRGLQMSWRFESEFLKRFVGERFVVTEVEKLGTDVPWVLCDFNELGVDFVIPVAYEKGFKTSFIKQGLRRRLKTLLKRWIEDIEEVLIDESLDLDSEVWPHTSQFLSKKVNLNKRLLDISTPGRPVRLNRVYYYGPLNQGQLGLLSGLLAIKEAQTFI